MLIAMEEDARLREHIEAQRRSQERMEALRVQIDALIATLTEGTAHASDAEALAELLAERERVAKEQREQGSAFVRYVREIEEAKRRSAMAERRPPTPRSQERIERISEELTTKLRLDRVDDAIKELLAFLADAEFFAANIPTGRRRRLKSLQTAIESALA
jgi:hypothetical protein